MRLDLDPQELERLVDTLASRVAEKLRPLLKAQGQDGDIIFTPDTLSAYLHISKDKIYNLTHLKEIPYFKVGRELRFKKADIDSWLRETYTPALDGSLNLNKGRVKICQG